MNRLDVLTRAILVAKEAIDASSALNDADFKRLRKEHRNDEDAMVQALAREILEDAPEALNL